ncbi:hypothetical protein VCHA34P129_40201 [Vibrio chagasii]|nr:hypothetical protein VCHA34P129_40201 [Vibrio chagasii]CAH7305321.1 hypothetical protein VCHA52P455_40201 [Vibrio chagasii]
MDDRSLFLELANTDIDIEKMLKIAGLDEISTAWIMFAYISPSNDWESQAKVTNYMERCIEFKGFDSELAKRIARVVIEERLMSTTMTQNVRAAVIGVSRRTYVRKKNMYETMIKFAESILLEFESNARKLMVSYNKDCC